MASDFQLDAAAVNRLAESDAVVAGLQAAVDQVAANARRAAAGIRIDGDPGDLAVPIDAGVSRTGGRLHGYVGIDHPAGLAVEAKHRVLGSAIATST